MATEKQALSVFDQLRTSRGQLPISSVELRVDEACFAFTLAATPEERLSTFAEERGVTLFDLPFCRTTTQIRQLLEQTGPLIGNSAKEPFSALEFSFSAAQSIIMLQKLLNDEGSLAEASTIRNVLSRNEKGKIVETSQQVFVEDIIEKTDILAEDTGRRLVMYMLSFPVGTEDNADYLRMLVPTPGFKKLTEDGMADCAFYNVIPDEDGMLWAEVVLISGDQELTPTDFYACMRDLYEEYDSEDYLERASELIREAGLHTVEEPYNLAQSNNLTFDHDAVITEDDRARLQRLIRILISLHMGGISVDVFSAREEDNYISFPSYLSFLWYEFARNLRKVDTCIECGKGFNLEGHRGLKKQYCSDACRTKAHNRAKKEQRDAIRTMFLDQNMSVEEIARIAYPDKSVRMAAKQVLNALKNSKELRWAAAAGDATIVERLKEANLLIAGKK